MCSNLVGGRNRRGPQATHKIGKGTSVGIQGKPPGPGHSGPRPTEEVDRCVPQELSLDCCLENERVLGHTGRPLASTSSVGGFWGSPRARVNPQDGGTISLSF